MYDFFPTIMLARWLMSLKWKTLAGVKSHAGQHSSLDFPPSGFKAIPPLTILHVKNPNDIQQIAMRI